MVKKMSILIARRNRVVRYIVQRFLRRNAPDVSLPHRVAEWVYSLGFFAAGIFILETFREELHGKKSIFDVSMAVLCLAIGFWIFLFGFHKRRLH